MYQKRIQIDDGSAHTNTIKTFIPVGGNILRVFMKGTNPSIVIKQAISGDNATLHTHATVTSEGITDVKIFPDKQVTVDITGDPLYLHIMETNDIII